MSRSGVSRARLALIALAAASACVHGPPRIEGAAATPPNQTAQWTPTKSVTEAAARDVIRADKVDSIKQYTLAEAIDIALRNSPLTRQSWVQARAAADVYGSNQGRLYPTLVAGVAVNRSLALSSPNRPAGERTQYGPSGSLTYTVLDFGGRTGSIDVARQTAIAADLTHNSTVQNTILLVETAAFTYLSTRAQRDAQKSSLDLATAALDAANERHHVGLATIADVLQARTARSQAELQLQTLEGILLVTKGSLAVSMGLPANTAFDVPAVTLSDSVHFITESVDSLIDVAVRNRPELASARAQAEAAHSQIQVARSGYLPSLAFTGTGANNASNISTFSGNTYSLNLGVAVPVFSGFSNHYDVAAANEQFQAAQARTELTRQQIIQQVFTAYYTLRTATDRVRTARDLLASAIQSEEVARGRYKEGVGSIVDLLVAQSALASARSQDIDSRWQWRSALAQLAHDVGVLNARGDTSFAPFTPAPDVRPKQ
ncbi:MAG TPA: TolC family protein [Gemmatimonadaceae bacterium]